MTEGRVIDVDVSAEMESSYLEYAYSVIYSRALPDARDGLKPVQRRIVYQMGDMGLRPDRGHVKSSRIVGDVMGKLHPHGDSAIYDALVRLSQDFIMRVPLVDGHGNFGSLDDGPAAPRYTEARLTTASMQMIAGLDEEVVDFVPNYDNTLTQPDVLPAAFPNLLINGASGIAVGMATNMAPHNPGEVIAACDHLIRNPDADLAELMRFIPGPDLPTGGRIIGLDGVREAYETGRGTFRTRATVSIENINARRKGIVVTEPPTSWDRRRSSRRSRTPSGRRSSPASPRSTTTRTGRTACGSSSGSRTASTRRRSSPSSTGRPRSRSPSGSTTSASSRASRAPSGRASSSPSTSPTASTSCAGARSSSAQGQGPPPPRRGSAHRDPRHR